METFHNPDRFMSGFRQALSRGRKCAGLLAGAGRATATKLVHSKMQQGNKPIGPELSLAAIASMVRRRAVLAGLEQLRRPQSALRLHHRR
jgi:hypothetical protein